MGIREDVQEQAERLLIDNKDVGTLGIGMGYNSNIFEL